MSLRLAKLKTLFVNSTRDFIIFEIKNITLIRQTAKRIRDMTLFVAFAILLNLSLFLNTNTQ